MKNYRRNWRITIGYATADWQRCDDILKAYFPLGEFVRANRQKSRNGSYLFAANFFASQF